MKSLLFQYKHIHVREDDICLQVVEWGGLFFVDRSLTFGCGSSPGLYTVVSSVVKEAAIAREGLLSKDTYQVLDDCGMIGDWDDVSRFYNTYNDIGDFIGVKMAPRGDPDKSFEVACQGTVLGVHYDTQSWTWSFCERKQAKILNSLFDIVEADTVEQKVLESISGKLGHYKAIVSEYARWERGYILYLAVPDKDRQGPGRWRKGPALVEVTKELREQCWWWIRAFTAAGKEKTSIPDVRPWFPTSFVELYPDAAGGSDTSTGNGFGGVLWNVEGRPMVYGTWPTHIQCNMKNEEGEKFARKLTLLEGVAALATLCAVPEAVAGKAVKIYTDNKGLAMAYGKAHSRDKYTYSIMMAIMNVAKYLNIKLAVVWTPRCSSPGEVVADHLSKAKFQAAGQMAGVAVDLKRVPRTLLKWVERPVVTRLLGYAILNELEEAGTQVLVREPEDKVEITALQWRK